MPGLGVVAVGVDTIARDLAIGQLGH